MGSEHIVVNDKSIGGSIAGPGSSITTASHTEESVSSMVAGTCAQHKQYCCLCPSVRGYMLAGGVMVYSYAELEAGRKQFDATTLVGVGGFGRVF